jgi:RND family efflux transporter MFP subunit
MAAIAGVFLAGSWYGQRGGQGTAAVGARKILYYVDPMHPAYKSDKPGIAPDCGMELVPVYEDGSAGSVSVGAEGRQLLGVKVGAVERRPDNRTVRFLGRVVPDESGVYRVNAGIAGYIRDIAPVTTGSQVRKDQVLATFSAPDSINWIQAYLVALNAMDRLRQDGQERAASTALASSNYQQRLEQLQNLGMAPIQIEEIKRTREVPERIRILAPADGFVLARNLTVGQKFDRGAEWFQIADLGRVWILADVFPQEARHLRPGARARVTLPELGTTLMGRVAEILPQFDESTRTLKVRIEADNPGYALRPGMFVDVELPVALPPTLAVPADAVVDSGLKKAVYVVTGEGVFEPRRVETGWRHGNRVEIVSGLTPGERIVVSGTFLIDSESRMKTAAAGVHGESSEDPVCGMEVDQSRAKATGKTITYQGQTFHFCSDECKTNFEKSPAGYAAKAGKVVTGSQFSVTSSSQPATDNRQPGTTEAGGQLPVTGSPQPATGNRKPATNPPHAAHVH